MALYAFDGTGNSDDGPELEDTNVVRFRELYAAADFEYLQGVGTRFGGLGRVFGGLFGAGGRTRIDEMYDTLCENFSKGDTDIDIIGFSRGAALAVHFANRIADQGIEGSQLQPTIRFLGLWDLVASFGLSFNNIVRFQDLNLGWDVDSVPGIVEHCFHALALDERREAFGPTRLDPDGDETNVCEVWFRGVHSDVGGGNGNTLRSNIALQWMIQNAIDCGIPINTARANESRYTYDANAYAPVSQNKDLQRDDRRVQQGSDVMHESVSAKLGVGEHRVCEVRGALQYNWSGVELEAGSTYEISVAEGQQWSDGDITCDANGWESSQLPWANEKVVDALERFRRAPKEDWYCLVGCYGDEDKRSFKIGSQAQVKPKRHCDLYLYANDMASRYGNNEGQIQVSIKRVA